MQKIELACFKDSQECQIISSRKSFQFLLNQNEDYFLEINNYSAQDCELELNLIPSTKIEKEIDLLVFSQEKLLFQGNLVGNEEKIINFSKILANSKENYQFFFNFNENETIFYQFDLNFSFFCRDQSPETANSLDNSSKKLKTGEVLGQSKLTETKEASATNHPGIIAEKNFGKRIFPYLILLVFLIFVIMIFRNGKQKKDKFKKSQNQSKKSL